MADDSNAPEERSFITPENSILTVEAFAGCSIGCAYCFRWEKDENSA